MNQSDTEERIFHQQLLRTLGGINEKLGDLIASQTEFVWAHICCEKMIQPGKAAECQICPDDAKAVDIKIRPANIDVLKNLVGSARLARGP
jgi:hypothetical protein